MELIDVVDENGNLTGEVATRNEIHTKGLWHKIIVVAVIDENGHILMQQRAKTVETNPLKWDVTSAGHIQAGQTSKDAAIRELSEEVRVKVNEDDLHYLLTYKNKKILENYLDNQFYDCYLVKQKNIDMNKIKMQESEVEQVKICNLNEVKEMIENEQVVAREKFYTELLKYLKN